MGSNLIEPPVTLIGMIKVLTHLMITVRVPSMLVEVIELGSNSILMLPLPSGFLLPS